MQIKITPEQLSTTLNRLLLSPDAVTQLRAGISYISLIQGLTDVVAIHCGGEFTSIDATGDELIVTLDTGDSPTWVPTQLFIESYRVALLSSRHLSPQAVAGLYELSNSSLSLVSQLGEGGWYVRVRDSSKVDPWQSSFDDVRFPCESLQNLASHLMASGYTAFEFQHDAPVLPGFPVYDHGISEYEY